MTVPPALIVGTGRSGSGYLSRLLRACGVNCGHEEHWNPQGTQASDLDADSSWCALALGDGPRGGFKPYDGRILLQVRHPLDVVTSLIAAPMDNPYLDLAAGLIARRLVVVYADTPTFALAFVVSALRAARELTYDWWRVEDLTDPRSGAFDNVLRHLHRQPPASMVTAALAAVPTDYNRHRDTPRLSWDDLPPGPLRDALASECDRYGYTT